MVTSALSHYLDSVRDNLRLDDSSEKDIIDELQTHIEDRLEELKQTGLSEEEAVNTCMKLLGSAKSVARQIYEAHSQGTWKQTLLATMPHLLFGLLFVLNWWQGIGWLSLVLVLTLSGAIYGWYRDKPTWLLPWLSYSLVPVVIAGLFLFYLPEGWSWVAIVLYVPLASWLLYNITVKTIKRDWLYSSLMLLPVPIIVGWFLAAGSGGKFAEFSLEQLRHFAPGIGLSFLLLAASVAIFIRFRQRWLKAAVLPISGLLTLTLVAYYTEGRLGVPTFLVLVLVVLGLFITPALLEHKIRHSDKRGV